MELLPWLLDTQGRTTRFSHSPASHRVFPDFPTIVFCLQQCDSAFSDVSKSWKMLLPLSVASFKTYLKDLKVLWPSQTFHQLNFYYDLGAIFQIIFHCIYHPFFNWAPADYRLFLGLSQGCLPPSIACRGRRILSPWCSFVFVPR